MQTVEQRVGALETQLQQTYDFVAGAFPTKLYFKNVASLPTTPQRKHLYITPNGWYFWTGTEYLTVVAGTVSERVDTFADLAGLSVAAGTQAFVADATGDATVTTGWAIYQLDDASSWVKISEQESLDLNLSHKLSYVYINSLPGTLSADTLYIQPDGTITFYDGANAISVGGSSNGGASSTAPVTASIPVPIMLGFNSSLDNATRTRLYFAGSIDGVEWSIDPTKVTQVSFVPQLLGQPPAGPFNNTGDLQVWIDDFTSATTPFYVEVIVTFAASVTYGEEVTGTFTHYHLITLPTVFTVEGATGYASYRDTQYTQSNPLRLIGGQWNTLPNNAGIIVADQIPVGVTALYDPNTSKITPDAAGDGYNLQINFEAAPTVIDTKIKVAIDIGGTIGKLFPQDFRLDVPAGSPKPVYAPVSGAYSGPTFKQNGGLVQVYPQHDVDVWSYGLVIKRDHKAR